MIEAAHPRSERDLQSWDKELPFSSGAGASKSEEQKGWPTEQIKELDASIYCLYDNSMDYEFDPDKDEANRKKHG